MTTTPPAPPLFVHKYPGSGQSPAAGQRTPQPDNPDPPTLAALWSTCPEISCLHASGDGRWAVWSWSGMTENAEIWCAPTDAGADPVRLTDSRDPAYVRGVSTDGAQVLFVRSRDLNEHDQLFLLDRRTGTETALTRFQTDHYLFGGQFSPDGTTIAWVADCDEETGAVTPGGWVYLFDIATQTRRVLLRTEGPFETGVTFSPDGRTLLWRRMLGPAGSTRLWVIPVDGTPAAEVLNPGDKVAVRGNWLDDDRIAVVADGTVNDRVGILHWRTGKTDWLVEEPGLNPQEVIPGAQGQIAVHAYADATLTPLLIDAAGTRRHLPNRSGRRSLLPLVPLPDGGWLAEAYDAAAPHQLVRILPGGGCITLASAPDTPARRHTRPQDIRWTGPDGLAVQGWLYRPQGPSRGLIAYIHGGPTWHSEDWVNPMIQFWVQAGFTVLDPNYRGSTGFGQAYRLAIKQDGWGGREQDDIRAGILALVAQGIAQPGRIAVVGNSYGGFSSWVAITRWPDLVRAAIPMCGMYKLDIDYDATEMPWGRSYSAEMMGGTPDEVPERYASASPGNFVHQIKGHLMIVHGLADSNVGPENTHAAIRDLTAAGIQHDTMLLPDEGHGIARRGNLAEYLQRTDTFLSRAFGENR